MLCYCALTVVWLLAGFVGFCLRFARVCCFACLVAGGFVVCYGVVLIVTCLVDSLLWK